MAGCFIALALLPKEDKTWIQVFFTGASLLNALNTVGVDKSCQLVSSRSVSERGFWMVDGCQRKGNERATSACIRWSYAHGSEFELRIGLISIRYKASNSCFRWPPDYTFLH